MPSSDLIEGLTRLSGVLSLLVVYQVGRGGGWQRARQRLLRARLDRGEAGAPSGRPAAPRWPGGGTLPPGRRWRSSVTGLLLAAVGALLVYAAVKTGGGWADLEAMGAALAAP